MIENKKNTTRPCQKTPEYKEQKRLYDIEYREKNREKIVQKGKKYRSENYEMLKIKKAADFQKNKQRYQDNWKKHVLRYRYGITVDQYNKILKDQGGVCKICKKVRLSAQQKRMGVDHCHETDKIRGILCDWCNMGISKFADNVELMQEAIKYLQTNGDDISIGERIDTRVYKYTTRGGLKWKRA